MHPWLDIFRPGASSTGDAAGRRVRRVTRALAAVCLASALAACGGGGADNGEPGPQAAALGSPQPASPVVSNAGANALTNVVFNAAAGTVASAVSSVTAANTVSNAVASVAARGTRLGTDWSTYPRAVKLAHQPVAADNGLVVASISERSAAGWRPGIYRSADDGQSFTALTAIVDADFRSGVCCGSLFELPRAVGYLPRGTLLYATSVGYDWAGATVENRIYASHDGGRSFGRLHGAHCGVAALPRVPGQAGTGVWEPEFLLAGDGSLACVYADETEPGKSQVLKLTHTHDGLTWSTPRVIVAGLDAADRPGMPGIRALPGGRFVMAFEACSLSRLDCSARLKMSDDGLSWGAPSDFGTRPQTADGAHFRHTPTIAWMPVAGSADGALVLTGQLLADGAGRIDRERTGRVLMVNERADGSGAWRLAASPIGLATAPGVSSWCPNYSSPLLPLGVGRGLLMLQTDDTADGGCTTRFGAVDA